MAQALPKERFGNSSAIYTHFARWPHAGFFLALWQSGLAEYDDVEGIALALQSIDGAMIKAPLAQETVGRNPTDRGKKRHKATSFGGRAWCPALDNRNRSKST